MLCFSIVWQSCELEVTPCHDGDAGCYCTIFWECVTKHLHFIITFRHGTFHHEDLSKKLKDPPSILTRNKPVKKVVCLVSDLQDAKIQKFGTIVLSLVHG
mmetsp:Transcript_49403/g.49781  ORF Transcript_49403/g.49781 Transcript_49403/m.49781 type:complete len:100 (-) Transcript_49403:228-527(-)